MTSNQRTQRWLLSAVAQQPTCHYCAEPVALQPPNDGRTRRATTDHVVPRALGGTHARVNLVVACWSCNQDRGTDFICWCDVCCNAIAFYATRWLDPDTSDGTMLRRTVLA